MAKSYIKINNYSNNGSLFIASKVFKDIAIEKLKTTSGVVLGLTPNKKGRAQDYDFDKNITVNYKDGNAELYIVINVQKGIDVNKLCIELQKEILEEISILLEQVSVQIKIKVANII